MYTIHKVSEAILGSLLSDLKHIQHCLRNPNFRDEVKQIAFKIVRTN